MLANLNFAHHHLPVANEKISSAGAVSKEMNLGKPPIFVLGSIFGTMTSVKGMIPISHSNPLNVTEP